MSTTDGSDGAGASVAKAEETCASNLSADSRADGSHVPSPSVAADEENAGGESHVDNAEPSSAPGLEPSSAPRSEPGSRTGSGSNLLEPREANLATGSGELTLQPHQETCSQPGLAIRSAPSSEHEHIKDGAKKKDSPDKNERHNLKASIYFKVSEGRTVNRTFPGDVNKTGRKLLQLWSRQFRDGHSCKVADERKVLTRAKRNGNIYVSRSTAFGWFRRSHEKFIEHMLREESRSQTLMTGFLNVSLLQPLPQGIRVLSFLPTEFRNKRVKSKRLISGGDEFVEIVWETSRPFPKAPTTYYLNFGLTRVHVFTLQSGKGQWIWFELQHS